MKLQFNSVQYILVISATAMALALASEVYLGLLPCASCIFQRVIYLAIFISAVILIRFNKLVLISSTSLSLIGIYGAGSQIKSKLYNTAGCQQSFYSQIDNHWLTDFFPTFFEIKALCGSTQGHGASLILNEIFPYLSLLTFIVIFVFSFNDLFRKQNKKHLFLQKDRL